MILDLHKYLLNLKFIKKNLLEINIDTYFKYIVAHIIVLLTIPQNFCFLLCNICETRYYEPPISRLRHTESVQCRFKGMDLSIQDRISDSLLYCKSVQSHILFTICQVSMYMFEICYIRSVLKWFTKYHLIKFCHALLKRNTRDKFIIIDINRFITAQL